MSGSDWWKRVRTHPSPILAGQLAAAGIRAADFDVGDVARLPPVSPRDLEFTHLDDPVAAMRLGDAASPVRLGTCERGGATIVMTFTSSDLARVAVYGARALAAAGIAAGMKVANTLEGGLETPGSLIVGDALERLGALDVPLGRVVDERAAKPQAALLRRIAADVLIVDGPSGSALLDELRRDPPPSWRGTVWLGAQAVPEVPGWCRRWISVPETSVFFAVECASGTLHVDPDVDVAESGGHLRLHSLGGDAPLFGYEPGLALLPIPGPCVCGDRRLGVMVSSARSDLTRPRAGA